MKIVQIMPADEWMIRSYMNRMRNGAAVRDRGEEPLVGWGLTEDGKVIPLCWSAVDNEVVDATPFIDNKDHYIAQEWQEV